MPSLIKAVLKQTELTIAIRNLNGKRSQLKFIKNLQKPYTHTHTNTETMRQVNCGCTSTGSVDCSADAAEENSDRAGGR